MYIEGTLSESLHVYFVLWTKNVGRQWNILINEWMELPLTAKCRILLIESNDDLACLTFTEQIPKKLIWLLHIYIGNP